MPPLACLSSPPFSPQCRRLRPSPPTLYLVRLSCDVLTDSTATKKVVLAMAMVAGGPWRRCRQARLTGEKRNGRGRWPGRLGQARLPRRRTRHEVGRGAQAQAPADKNNHGDSERGGRGAGRRARVQAPTLRREPWRREAGEVACTTSRPDFILVLSSRPPVLNIVTFLNIVPYMWRHSPIVYSGLHSVNDSPACTCMCM